MLIPPPNSHNRPTQYYIDLGNGEVDPQNIINDIKHYEEQFHDLRGSYEKAIIERTKLTNELKRTDERIANYTKDIENAQHILASLGISLARNKHLKIKE